MVGDALDPVDRMREFAERRGDQHLVLFLEGAHAVASATTPASFEEDYGGRLQCAKLRNTLPEQRVR